MAFIFEGRNYKFKSLPFGLVNLVAVFVACMDHILGPEAVSYTHLDVYKRQHHKRNSRRNPPQKKNGKVRLCLDAREINKMIVNDRTSPGEIGEICVERESISVVSHKRFLS